MMPSNNGNKIYCNGVQNSMSTIQATIYLFHAMCQYACEPLPPSVYPFQAPEQVNNIIKRKNKEKTVRTMYASKTPCLPSEKVSTGGFPPRVSSAEQYNISEEKKRTR
jgi:hypothetical protein